MFLTVGLKKRTSLELQYKDRLVLLEKNIKEAQ